MATRRVISHIGWWPSGDKSIIAKRRCPRPTRCSEEHHIPSSSGPRCAITRFIVDSSDRSKFPTKPPKPHITKPHSPANTMHPKFGEQQSSTGKRPLSLPHDAPIPPVRLHRLNSSRAGLQAVRVFRVLIIVLGPRRFPASVDIPSTIPAFHLPRPRGECWDSSRKKSQRGSALHADNILVAVHTAHSPKSSPLPSSAVPLSLLSVVLHKGHTRALSTPISLA